VTITGQWANQGTPGKCLQKWSVSIREVLATKSPQSFPLSPPLSYSSSCPVLFMEPSPKSSYGAWGTISSPLGSGAMGHNAFVCIHSLLQQCATASLQSGIFHCMPNTVCMQCSYTDCNSEGLQLDTCKETDHGLYRTEGRITSKSLKSYTN